jgi:hypothetical protein
MSYTVLSEWFLFSDPSVAESDGSDYCIPPDAMGDAFASETSSLDIALSSGCRNLTTGVTSATPGTSTNPSHVINSVESSPRKESLEKSGYLTKLGGKLKTWRKRYFVLRYTYYNWDFNSIV